MQGLFFAPFLTGVSPASFAQTRFSLRLTIVVLAILVALAPCDADPTVTGHPVAMGPTVVPRSDRLMISSRVTGITYQVDVAQPERPPLLLSEKLPVVVVLDGGHQLAGPIAMLLEETGAMAPAFIVSVGYPKLDFAVRNHDLLFHDAVRNGETFHGGGAVAFENFLKDELLPLLASNYEIDPKRAILFGHSFGGLFAANILARSPNEWSGYVIASPSVWADPRVLAGLGSVAPTAHTRILVAYGRDEHSYMTDAGAAVGRTLAGRPQLEVSIQTFSGGHLAYYPQLVDAALRFMLPRLEPIIPHHSMSLDRLALRRVEGTYRLADGRRLTIAIADDGLSLVLEKGGSVVVNSQASDDFFAPGADVTLHIEAGRDALAPAVLLAVEGSTVRAVRDPQPKSIP